MLYSDQDSINNSVPWVHRNLYTKQNFTYVMDRNFHYTSGTGIHQIPDIDVRMVRHIDN